MPAVRRSGVLIGVLIVTALAVAAWQLRHRVRGPEGQAGGPPSGRPASAGLSGLRDLSLADALEQAGREGKLVMVFFRCDGSGPATHMEATTWQNPEVLAWVQDHAIAVRIDADRQADLALAHGIDRLPVTVFVRADGSEIGRVVGHQPPDWFIREGEVVLFGRK